MQVTRSARNKSLQTMRNTIKEKSSPTTATSSGNDIQAHVAQSGGGITAPIRPRGEANVGLTKAVQPSSRPIRRPRTPPPRPARHHRDPTATRPPHQGRASPPANAHSVSAVGRRGRRTERVGATRWCGARPAGPRDAGPKRAVASSVHRVGRLREYINGNPAGVVRLGAHRRPSTSRIRSLLVLLVCPPPPPPPPRVGHRYRRGVPLLALRSCLAASDRPHTRAADLGGTSGSTTSSGRSQTCPKRPVGRRSRRKRRRTGTPRTHGPTSSSVTSMEEDRQDCRP